MPRTMRLPAWIALALLLLGLAGPISPAYGQKRSARKKAPAKAAKPPEPKLPPFPPQAKSAIVIEELSGKVLFEKNADARRFPASTTKILTALLLLEKTKPTDVIVAPPDVETVGGSSLHLKPGESLTASEMLYALMLRSANDGCYAVAKHISGSVEAFAQLMNERAAQIGCTRTHFHNPHGLNDDQHWTSAHDLARMAREAMKRPEFRRVVATRKYQVTRSQNQEDRWLISKNHPLEKDPTADGIKTGYTNPAGHCYVGSATRNGFRVITVVLASPDWQTEHFALLDYAFKNFERKRLEGPGEIVRQVPIESGNKETVPAVLDQPVYYAAKKGHAPAVEAAVKVDSLVAPVAKGARIGTVEFRDGSGWKLELPLFAAEDVAFREHSLAAEILSVAWPFAVYGGAGLATLGLVGGFALRFRRRFRAL